MSTDCEIDAIRDRADTVVKSRKSRLRTLAHTETYANVLSVSNK